MILRRAELLPHQGRVIMSKDEMLYCCTEMLIYCRWRHEIAKHAIPFHLPYVGFSSSYDIIHRTYRSTAWNVSMWIQVNIMYLAAVAPGQDHLEMFKLYNRAPPSMCILFLFVCIHTFPSYVRLLLAPTRHNGQPIDYLRTAVWIHIYSRC